MQQQESVLMLSPTFSSYSSIRFAEIADRVCQEFDHEREDFGLDSLQGTIVSVSSEQNHLGKQTEEEIKSEVELDFSFSSRDDETVTISADEIFALLNKDTCHNDKARSPRCMSEKTVEASKVKKVSRDMKAIENLTQKKKGGSHQVVKSAHEIHYMTNRASKDIDRRRTFLPYQKDMLGLCSLFDFLRKNIRPF